MPHAFCWYNAPFVRIRECWRFRNVSDLFRVVGFALTFRSPRSGSEPISVVAAWLSGLVLRDSEGTEIRISDFEMTSRARYREPAFDVEELTAEQLAADLDHFEDSLRERFYDTNGIIPDVVIEQPPEHFLVDGPDPVLEAARKALLASPNGE